MDYVEQMQNLRYAMHVISEKVPTIRAMIEDMKRRKHYDPDLDVLTMCDREFDITRGAYDEIHEKMTRFDPEDEYGKIETLTEQEKRGYQ